MRFSDKVTYTFLSISTVVFFVVSIILSAVIHKNLENFWERVTKATEKRDFDALVDAIANLSMTYNSFMFMVMFMTVMCSFFCGFILVTLFKRYRF